ncbi:hypothetical protein [Vibrio parahaemolyticus]|uniref:hypothetical protein n=1 Tax=Vibrio parahaemolyticus TaxID=670 RepID=UPI002360AFC6|nr:hypothetical protein [Vibrio parahaemolyticus]MEA5291735.1 hypothetical protein [Vibrio parahaemolyticus]
MDENFLINSKREASFLLQGRKFDSISEFDLFSYEVLSKYVHGKERIEAIVKSKSFSFEVMFIRWAEGTVFIDFIDFFFANLRIALEYHAEEVLELYVNCDIDIHEALISYQDFAVMSSITSVDNKRTKVKGAFSSLGDVIESSLYPQLRLVYGVLTLSKDSSLYGKKTNLSDGKIVSELIESSEVVRATLNSLLLNVSLSQWRNISNHASYRYIKSSDSILCEYGKNNTSSISFEYHKLGELLKSVDSIQILLKTCVELSSFDLCIKKHTDNNDERYELTKESVMSHIGNVLAILDYEVLSLDKVLNNWKINIVDVNSLGVNAFRELGCELMPYFLCMFKLYGVFVELEVFDTYGNTFHKLSLGRVESVG